MRKFKTLLTYIVLVIFNSTDIYSQNTDNTFGIFESLVGTKFYYYCDGCETSILEFELMNGGQTLAIMQSSSPIIYLNKTDIPNRFIVKGKGWKYSGGKIKNSFATITADGVLQVEKKYKFNRRYDYKLTNRGIEVEGNTLSENGKWINLSKYGPSIWVFADQRDHNTLLREINVAGYLIDYGDVYSNEQHPLREFYRAIGLKGTDLKIDLKTKGKTKVTLYDSNGNSIDSVESNANAILSFPITKDDIYFISVLRDDDSIDITLRFRLEIKKTETEINAEMFGRLGWEAYEKGDYDKCMELSKKASELNQNLGWVHNNIGLVYLIKGDYISAIDSYSKAITFFKKSANPSYWFNEAIKDLKALIAKHGQLKGANDILEMLQNK